MRRRRAALALALSLSLPTAARAEEATVERAQALFDVGAQAYAQGDFNGAIEAFEEAYRASARPGILFSIAQAHRKQFYVTREPARLRAAIEHYHAYLGKVSTGKYRVIAADALAELEPIAARVAPEAAGGAPALKPTAAATRTRLMISSAAPGALVSLDGAPLQPSPLITDAKPGPHTVRVEAEGYAEAQRQLVAVEGGLVTIDVPLQERPARLLVRAEDGADITVDRRPVGRTPLPGPLELGPGRHFVAVTRNGRRPFGEEVELARGESRSITAELGLTPQRVASYLLAAAAGAGVVVGGVFVGVAFHEQAVAESTSTARKTHNISPGMLDGYGAALASREDFKRAATGTLGGALALGVAAGALFVFDTPRAPTSLRRTDEAPSQRPRPAAPLEVSALPLAGPGFVGAGVIGAF